MQFAWSGTSRRDWSGFPSVSIGEPLCQCRGQSNPEWPSALLRIFDLDLHPPDTMDFDGAVFAVLHGPGSLVISATCEHVADFKRGNARSPGHDLGDGMLHVVCVAILTKFIVL